jgi:hypothetical protein
MTDRLDDAFGSLDQLDPPDQWAEIERRAEMRVVLPALAPGHRRYRWIVAAAVIVVVAMIALVAVAADDPPSRVTTTEPSTPTTTGARGSAAKVRTYWPRSALTCDTGVVLPDPPPDGLTLAGLTDNDATNQLSWDEGKHQVTITVEPRPLYGIVPTSPGEVVLTGTKSALVRTTLPAPCELVGIKVRPGDAGGVAAIQAAAGRLTVIPTAGGHECGPPPARSMTGPIPTRTPADAVISYLAWAIGAHDPSAFGEITQDPTAGPCRVFLTYHPSKLQVDTFVTGSPGAYRVTSISGATASAVQHDVPIRVNDRSVRIEFADPCEGCTKGTADLAYVLDFDDPDSISEHQPALRVHASAERRASGWQFEGTLASAPPNSATGRLLLLMRDREGAVRAIVARTIPGGDYSTR